MEEAGFRRESGRGYVANLCSILQKLSFLTALHSGRKMRFGDGANRRWKCPPTAFTSSVKRLQQVAKIISLDKNRRQP